MAISLGVYPILRQTHLVSTPTIKGSFSHFGIPLLGRPNRRASGIHTHFGALHVVQAPASATLSEVDHADPPKCGTDVGDGARQVCGTDNGTKVGSAHCILQATGCGH